MKDRKIKIELSQEAIKYTFKNAIQEVESLREFYTMYRDTWIKDKLAFEQKYAIALEINKVIEKLADSEDIENEYSRVKESMIGGTKFQDIIELNLEKSEKPARISYSMRKKYMDQDPQKARDRENKYKQQKEIFVRSILSNIVIIFERYFARIFEFVVVLDPEKYFEGKTVKINELFCSSYQQIIRNEVQRYVSDNMYDSLKTLDLMKQKSGFNIDRYVPIQDEFEEVYYRRNIFVHNSGIINDIYINSVSEKYKKNLKSNTKLICDDVYIEAAIETLKKVVCVLLYEFLLGTNASSESYNILGDIAFSSLSNKQYSFCEFIYNVLRRHKNFDFADKAMYEVNYMIALKQQGKSISKNLEKFDTSAMQEQFVVAKYCLQDDNENVYRLLNKMYPDTMSIEAIRDWPLFIDFRKSKEYDQFVSEHKQEFEVYSFETSDLPQSEEIADVICNEP